MALNPQTHLEEDAEKEQDYITDFLKAYNKGEIKPITAGRSKMTGKAIPGFSLQETYGTEMQANTTLGQLPNNISFDELTDDLGSFTFDPKMDYEAAMANNQNFMVQVGASLAAGVIKGGLTALEDVGYMMDLTNWTIPFMDDVDTWEGNMLSDLAVGLKEDIDEGFGEIYRKNRAENPVFDPLDFGSYAEALKGVVDSGVGFLLPGLGIAKGLSMASKAMRLQKYVSLMGQNPKLVEAMNAGLAATATNYAEGKIMGMELHDSVLKGALEAGHSREVSEEMANDAASSFLLKNRVFILTNYIQLHGVIKGIGSTRGGKLAESALKDNAYKKLINPDAFKVSKLTDSFIFQGAKEYGEEVGQFGLQAAEEKRALEGELGFGNYLDNFIEAIGTSQAQLEGSMGIFGAGGQKMATNLITGNYGKDNETARQAALRHNTKAVEETLDYINSTIKQRNTESAIGKAAAENEDESTLGTLGKMQFYATVARNLATGTTDHIDSYLKSIEDGSIGEERLNELGEGAQERASELREELISLEKQWIKDSSFNNPEGIFRSRLFKTIYQDTLDSYQEKADGYRDGTGTDTEDGAQKALEDIAKTHTYKNEAGETESITFDIDELEDAKGQPPAVYEAFLKDAKQNENLNKYLATKEIIKDVEQKIGELQKEIDFSRTPKGEAAWKKEQEKKLRREIEQNKLKNTTEDSEEEYKIDDTVSVVDEDGKETIGIFQGTVTNKQGEVFNQIQTSEDEIRQYPVSMPITKKVATENKEDKKQDSRNKRAADQEDDAESLLDTVAKKVAAKEKLTTIEKEVYKNNKAKINIKAAEIRATPAINAKKQAVAAELGDQTIRVAEDGIAQLEERIKETKKKYKELKKKPKNSIYRSNKGIEKLEEKYPEGIPVGHPKAKDLNGFKANIKRQKEILKPIVAEEKKELAKHQEGIIKLQNALSVYSNEVTKTGDEATGRGQSIIDLAADVAKKTTSKKSNTSIKKAISKGDPSVDNDDIPEETTAIYHLENIGPISLQVAWKSLNASDPEHAALIENARALTELIENPNNELVGTTIQYEIDEFFLSKEQKKRLKSKKPLSEDEILDLPIAAWLLGDDGKKTGLRFWLHNGDFDFKNRGELDALLYTKKIILENINKGIPVASSISEEGYGVLNTVEESTALIDIFGEEFKLVYRADKGTFIESYTYVQGGENIEKEATELDHSINIEKQQGGVFISGIKAANGVMVPIKVAHQKLDDQAATLVYMLYKDLISLGDKVVKGKKQYQYSLESKISQEVKDFITNSASTQVNGLLFHDWTYSNLLSFLVHNGENTINNKNSSSILYMQGGRVYFGHNNNKYAQNENENFFMNNYEVLEKERLSTNANWKYNINNPNMKAKFIKNLMQNNYFNVSKLFIDNKKAIKFWANSGVLQTHVRPTPEGNFFVNPILNFSPTLLVGNQEVIREVKKNATKDTKREESPIPVGSFEKEKRAQKWLEEQTSEVEVKKADIDNLLSKEKTIKIGRYTPSARFSDRVLGENVNLEVEDALASIVSFTRGPISKEQISQLNEVLDLFSPVLSIYKIDGLIYKYENEVANFTEIIEGLNRIKQDKISQPTQQTSEVEAPIENNIDKINTEIALLELELLEDVELALHAKTLRDSEKFQDLIKKRKIEENKANKIVPVGELSTENIIDIEEFSEFVDESLPEFITVEDINTLTDNMKAGGVRVGMFAMSLKNIAGNMSVDGTIYVGANSPYKYHEAFHSVYRLLLTDQEIIRYRSIARKEVRAKLRAEGKSFKTELERFRNSADTYLNMSQSELKDRYYEEYLADEFDKFKLNPKNTKVDAEVKSLFVRIMEWIKAIFSTNTKNELETLFESIDLGKYKDATLVSNEFTNSLAPGITLEANALVPYNSDTVVTEVGGVKQTRVGYLYLDSEVADLLVSGISATYADRVRNVEGEYNPAELLQGVMDDYNLLYNPLNSINENQPPAKVEMLNQIQTAFKIYPEVIKKNVVDQLNLIGSQIQDEEFTEEEFEDSLGLRTSSQFDKDASLIGGLSSLSFKLRLYIASTTTSATDYFGNTLLKEGEKIIVGVNFREAYNGLLKAVKNIQDPLLMLRSMYFFGQDNSQAGAVVSRILKDVGITEIELLEGASFPVQLNNPELLQSLLAGFQNFRVDYIFNETDSKGKIRIYSAAQRDDANSQLQKWNQAYIGKRKQFDDPKVKRQIARLLNSLNSSLKDTNNIDDVTLQNQARDYSERLFNLTGIKLSPLYLQFSMVQNIIDNTSVKQKALLSINTEESPLDIADVEQMRLAIQRNSNLFTNAKGGILSRLNDLAANSAPFDETIGATVFKNSNGDLVYAHQLPTYHLKTVQSLNSISELNRLMDLNPYMRDNFLLNSEAFKAMSNQNKIRVVRIAGSKTVDEILSEEDINDNISKNVSSQTYNEFTTKDFALALINNYTAYLNTKSDKVDVITELGSTKPLAALAPVLIRVIESSGTADMIALPVIEAVESVKGKVVLTEKAVDEFYNKINTEFTRINLEAFKLEDGSIANEMLMGYNDSVDGRAFKFSNTNMMFSDALQSNLANIAIEEGKKLSIISLEDAIKTAGLTVNEFKNNIVEKVEIQYDKFNETLISINASESLSNNITKGPMIAKGISSMQLDNSANLLNLTNNKDYNLKQIFFNNWINTSSINEVLLGDEAVTLKNSIDQIKRAKAQNAAYISAYSAITAPKLGIMHPNEDVSLITIDEIIGKSSITEESIDRADAQMWMTTKAFRYTQFAFGNLDTSMAGLIDNIEAGVDIKDDAVFGTDEKVGYIDQQAMLNSKKLVYADGKTYLKISAFVLTKEYTSKYNDNTKAWEAKPNRIPLHNLRVAMEAIEASKNTISVAVPLSGSKMLKRRIVQSDSIDPNNTSLTEHSTLDARYFGLQVVNPSNKLEGLDPTQIKEIATSEQVDSVEIPGLGLNEKGKVMRVGDVRRLYNFTVSQRLELSFKNKRNLTYTFDSSMDELKVSKEKGAITPNLVAFLNYATNSLKASQSSSSLIEFFSTTDGVQNYNLNNPLTIRKFEQLFFSYFSRGVFSERVPSLGLTLVSDYGNSVYRKVYEIKDGIPIRSEIIREKIAEKMNLDLTLSINELTPNTPGISEGIIVLDRLRTNLMGYTDVTNPDTATGERYTEGMMPAHFKSVRELIENGNSTMPEVISKMFSVRIPTQDNHSAMGVKLVDFMPVFYGSSAMFAQELVEISGADFDNDKAYTLIKDFYVVNNKFIEYGKGSDSYFEYITYINEKVNKAGTVYSEALALYNNRELQARIENSATENDLTIASDAGLSEKAIRSLQILGLPITNVQFNKYKSKYGEPYAAPLNNKILDYKYALITNTGVTENKDGGIPISYQPANTLALTTVLETLATKSDYFKNKLNEEVVDVNNLDGMIKSFEANNGTSIGAVVKPNLYLSLLTEYKIKVKPKSAIRVNGNTYNNYGVTVVNGQRKQDTISALVTMETDNSKDRLVSKLGLNRHAVSLVTNLTALGVPLETSILLVNVPLIRQHYTTALNKEFKFDKGIRGLVLDSFRAYKEGGAKLVQVNDAILLESINSNGSLSSNNKMYSILDLFLKANRIKEFTSDMGAITGLSKGLGKNMVEINETAEKIENLFMYPGDAPMNLSPIYKGKTFQNTYLRLFYQVKNTLMPATFLTASSEFTDILKGLRFSLNTDSREFTEETMQDVRVDLLSYLTIKSFDQYGLNNAPGKVATLNNNIVYPNDGPSIIDIVDRLQKYVDSTGDTNVFLNDFIARDNAIDLDNNTGMNLINANSFRNITAGQKIDLQNDYAKLYGNLTTKDDAISILNYIMVKDGFQLKYNSLLEAISPFVMSDYLGQINSVERVLRGQSTYESVFNMSKEELIRDFKLGYLSSNINNSKIVSITPKFGAQKESPITFKRKDGVLTFTDSSITSKDLAEFKRLEISQGSFLRVSLETGMEGMLKTETYYSPGRGIGFETEGTYNRIDTMGSNQQTGIGFMFGERPSYEQVRAYVKNKNGEETTVDQSTTSISVTKDAIDKQVKEDILKSDTTTIVATNNSVDVKVTEDSKAVNISNSTSLLTSLLSRQDAIEEEMNRSMLVSETDAALPALDPKQQIQYDLFESNITDESAKYPYLAEQYDEMLKVDTNKEIMMDNNLFPFSSMVEEYQNSMKYESRGEEINQQEFIDNIKKCILK